MSIKTIIKPVFKVLSLVLVLSVLLPSAVKLSHVFNHHKHEVCKNDSNSTTHFHEIDLDCEFYKFKLNTNYYSGFYTYETIIQNNFSKLNACEYLFLRTHQQNTSHLRGPPTLV
ncbi:hypothetical protein ACPX19_13390 [Winogradskyella sp. HB-48]|uniref:hypothetical protein n=1 Tax=Winogradskyella sp. HB-48 TaxID=3416808 RepID=UPI003CEA6B29